MRDEHLDSGHQEGKSQGKLSPSDPDIDEIQPLFFDLIRLDKVEAVKSILHHFSKLDDSVRNELEDLVAFSGSASMAEVVCTLSAGDRALWHLARSIEGMNFETFRWFLSRIDDVIMKNRRLYDCGDVLRALLVSGSLEMLEQCDKMLIDMLTTNVPNSRKKEIPSSYSISQWVISATAGDLVRENILLSVWAALEMSSATSRFNSQENLDNALINVARSTCSLALTKALLEYGANANSQKHHHYMSPLHHAARQSSPQAAELMKFLLYHGADPEITSSRSKLKISEEKGAKEIAKWLGMSWDELIQKIKLDREKGICPPEYT